MKSMMIYGINYGLNYDDLMDGIEYFTDKAERDDRLSEMSAIKKEPFYFRLSKGTAWRLNSHIKSRDKRKIQDLQQEIEELKEKLVAKIKIAYQ